MQTQKHDARRSQSPPFLSVIIPAYNEEQRIVGSLEKVITYLKSRDYTWEVIVVDDGSRDSTRDLVQGVSFKEPRVVLNCQPHRGKGHAVKMGMLLARGEYRFQCDADLSMPFEQISRFLPPQLADYDVAVGSREIPGARRIGEPWHRRLMGRVFNGLVRFSTVALKDTQCGFKCYAGHRAQNLFRVQRLDGFGFDVELLYVAQLYKLKIVQVPIDWYYMSKSKVRPVQDTFSMIRDLASIHRQRRKGWYNDLE